MTPAHSKATLALRLCLPILILLGLGALFVLGLQHDPHTLPSVKIGKSVPAFALPLLEAQAPAFTPESMQGKVWVLNVFASWCAACVQEHTSLLKLVGEQDILLLGMAYKDVPADTQQWLQQRGNPYQQVLVDEAGKVGIDLGVYGVPETYVIDGNGIIRYRHVGPIGEDFFRLHVAPLQNAAQQADKANTQAIADNADQAAVTTPTTKNRQLTEAEVTARVKALAEELRCLVCQNQTIADSNATLALDLKQQITQQVRAGRSDDEIKAYMTERYGEFILYDPPLTPQNAALWMLPFLLIPPGLWLAWRTWRQHQAQPEKPAQKSLKRRKELEALYQQDRGRD